PPGFAVLGFAITPMDDAGFREQMCEWVKKSPEVLLFRQKLWDEFAPALHYITADFESPDGYEKLHERLQELDSEHGCSSNRLFYCATPPSFYPMIAENLGKHGLVLRRSGVEVFGSGPEHLNARTLEHPNWTRIIIEKPFGRDLHSAQQLNDVLHQVFD